jgi:tetratricopeptide (TPR) repeat protein
MSQEERLSAVQEQPAFATLPVAEGLLEEIPNWWHRDPHHAGDLAEVAISILQPLEDAAPLAVSPSRVLEGLSHAWALRGNALRIQGELAKAEESLQRAGELAEQTNCLFALGRVARLLAKLLRGQRRFDEARESCSEAEEIYTRVRDSQMVARTRILRASILGESGDHEDAVAVLQDLLASQSRQDMGEENFLAASQSLCHRLVQAGQPQEALVQLDKVESLISALSAPLARCRVSWVRALALAEIGDNLQSEALLRQVLKTFLDHEIPYDAALVGLDLAALYLRTGALSGARELAQELNPIFLSRGIHREATAAGLVATQALERESATMALLENVRHFLRNVRRDPTLSYRAFSD